MPFSQAVVGRGHFSFFWLPVEVRSLIYRQLLVAKDEIINQRNTDPFKEATPIHTAILSTCRTISDEAVAILYGDNTFRWDFGSENSTPLLSPRGIVSTALLKNIQLILHLEDLGMSRGFGTVFVFEMNRTIACRDTFEIAFEYFHDDEYSDYRDYADLTNLLLQAIKHSVSFKKIIIRLPIRKSGPNKGDASWSPVLTKELESGLGPNLSPYRTSLEFHPRDQPPNWIRQNVPHLMRLPRCIRVKIFRLVIGQGVVTYPPEDPRYRSRHTEWCLVPNVRAANPGRDLSILHTCEKLWEESWIVVLNTNYLMVEFDYSDPEMSYRDTLLPQGLSRVILDLHNLDNSSDLWDSRFNLIYLLHILRDIDAYSRAIIGRGQQHLVLNLRILEPQWESITAFKARNQFKGKRSRQNEYHDCDNFTYEEVNYIPFINERHGHDISIARALQHMTRWVHVDVHLMPITVKNHCWRHHVTEWLEETLGPNLSKIRTKLCFRPRYYHQLLDNSRMRGFYEISDFMRDRKYFSKNAMDDLPEQWDEDGLGNSGADQDSDGENYHDDDNDSQITRSDSVRSSSVGSSTPRSVSTVHPNDDTMSVGAERALEAVEAFELAKALHLSASNTSAGEAIPESGSETEDRPGYHTAPFRSRSRSSNSLRISSSSEAEASEFEVQAHESEDEDTEEVFDLGPESEQAHPRHRRHYYDSE